MNMRLLSVFTTVLLVACSSEKKSESLPKDDLDQALEFNDLAIAADDKGEAKKAEKLYRLALYYDEIPAENRIVMLRNFANYFTGAQYNADSCRKYFQLALDISEENSFYYHMGRADLKLVDDDVAGALPDLMLAQRIDSSANILNNVLGLVFMGVYDGDFTDYEKALTYNKRAYIARADVNTVYLYIKNLYMLDRNEEAEAVFEEHKDNYNDVDIYYYGSVVKFELNKMDEGVELRNKTIELDSTYYDKYVDYIDWWNENEEGELPALPPRPGTN